jgi:hypothetical protein
MVDMFCVGLFGKVNNQILSIHQQLRTEVAMFSTKAVGSVISVFGLVFAMSICSGLFANLAMAQNGEPIFTTDFRLEDCRFTTKGMNPYFFLKPGYQLVLEGEEDGEEILLVITVLNKRERIDLREEGIGKVKTRIVEEREWVDGELAEISRNFFARCKQANAIFYFGEDVDIYENGEIVSHEGAWRAGEDGALPGLFMPGTFLLGSRYLQELAPEVAMDRAENVDMGLTIVTPAGTFENCVEVFETTPLDPDEESTKRYCPGIGLVFDDGVELVDFGFDIVDFDDDDDGDDDGEESAETEPASQTTDYTLFQNYPNPFNPETEIRFHLAEDGHVQLKIFNSLGQEVRNLIDAQYTAGFHNVRWDGKNSQGNTVSSGFYLYKLQANGLVATKKLVFMK